MTKWNDDNIATFPGRTITLEMSAAQVAYLRFLLFTDLHEEAETLAGQAHSAHETNGPADGGEVRDTFRGILGVTTGLLDLIGWDTMDGVAALRWLRDQEAARLTGWGGSSEIDNRDHPDASTTTDEDPDQE